MRPRIRTIKPEFYGDERICALPRDARLTAIGLMSCADDRGRLEFSVPAIRGLIFPRDKLTDRRVQQWVGRVVDIGFAAAYEVAPWPYLWLPRFWRHQVINRPSESLLPPHPEDPYGALLVVDALAKFREDSLNSHGVLTPSRAGARSHVPVPLPAVDVLEQQLRVDARANGKVDQDELPAGLPAELTERARTVLPVLAGVHELRGGSVPTLRGVGLAIRRYPDRDHLHVARDLEHWALAGPGQRKTVRDWARTFATFLDRADVATPPRKGNGGHQPGLDRERLASAHRLMARSGIV